MSSSSSTSDETQETPDVLSMIRKFTRPLVFYFIFRQSSSFFTNSDNKDLPQGGTTNTFEQLNNGAQPNDIFPSSKSKKPLGATPPSSNPLSSWIPDAVSNPYGPIPTFSNHGPQHVCAWGLGTPLDIDVFVTSLPSHSLSPPVPPPVPPLYSWSVSGWSFGSPASGAGGILGGSAEALSDEATVECTEDMKNNGTAYAHVYVRRHGGEPGDGHHTVVEMNKWRVRRKDRDVRNLMGDFGIEEEEEEEEEEVEDKSVLGEAAKDKTRDVWLSYWKPTLNLQMVEMTQAFPRNGIPPQMSSKMKFSDSVSGRYYPVLYVNEFWLTSDKLVPVNGTVASLPLSVSLSSVGMLKWQGMSMMEQ
ncbi:hypothetical protein TrRE_jg12510, partial [Triparma retinervis]